MLAPLKQEVLLTVVELKALTGVGVRIIHRHQTFIKELADTLKKGQVSSWDAAPASGFNIAAFEVAAANDLMTIKVGKVVEIAVRDLKA